MLELIVGILVTVFQEGAAGVSLWFTAHLIFNRHVAHSASKVVLTGSDK